MAFDYQFNERFEVNRWSAIVTYLIAVLIYELKNEAIKQNYYLKFEGLLS